MAFAYNNEMQIEQKPDMDIMFTYDVSAHFRSLTITKEILGSQKIRSLAYQINKCHKDFNQFPMAKRFDIHPAEILTGVMCRECNKFTMKWRERKWRCNACGRVGGDEYKASVEDWFMLIKNTMTNREFRYFTQLECSHVAKHLLGNAPTRVNR